jgi:pyruvate kinase
VDRRTKIVATLGPASASIDGVRRLVAAGADIFRLNCSHLTTDALRTAVRTVREASPLTSVLVDVQGPKMRYRGAELELSAGSVVKFSFSDLGLDEIADGGGRLAIRVGDRLLLHDGRIEGEIVAVDGAQIDVAVRRGGALLPGKGVNLPDTEIGGSLLGPKDRDDIAVAREFDVEVVAVSFVQSASDVVEVRRLRGDGGLVIAKIERPQAVKALDSILRSCDGVMAARGDLGVEIPYEDVPPVQRRIARRSIELGKFSICATEMLESMITASRPTRAEVADVSAAVRDGFDAVMLSAETAVGHDPAGAVVAMSRICRGAEPDVALPNLFADAQPEEAAVTAAAAALAKRIDADSVLSLTFTGHSARLLAACRPTATIIAATPDVPTARMLNCLRGVRPLVVDRPSDVVEAIPLALEAARMQGLVRTGDKVVVCASRMSPRSDVDTVWLHNEP